MTISKEQSSQATGQLYNSLNEGFETKVRNSKLNIAF